MITYGLGILYNDLAANIKYAVIFKIVFKDYYKLKKQTTAY